MADPVKDFYDRLAPNYHLMFEDWNASIARQAESLAVVLERECGVSSGSRVLDCACGIGTQALGLAARGFDVTATDISRAGIERVRAEAANRRLSVQAQTADMLDLGEISDHCFDVVLCMDNAVPHFESDDEIRRAAVQIRRKLRNGASFVGSIRDYDTLVRERPLVQGPAFYSGSDGRRIVHQVWDWLDERRYTFHLYITHEVAGRWESEHYVSHYRAVLREELSHLLCVAGFDHCRWIFHEESKFYQPIFVAK